MFGIGSTEIILFAALAYFVFLWKTVGPPRWRWSPTECANVIHHSNAKKHFLSLVLLVIIVPFVVPFVVIAIIALEEVLFDTPYFSDALEAIGLGWLLEAR